MCKLLGIKYTGYVGQKFIPTRNADALIPFLSP